MNNTGLRGPFKASGRYGLLLVICVLAFQGQACSLQGAPTPSTKPKSHPTLKEVLEFNPCETKLAEPQESEQSIRESWDQNKPIYDEAIGETAVLRSQFAETVRQFPFGFGVGVGSVGALALLVGIYRKRFVPRTAKGKQVSVLIPAALWSSFCFFTIAMDSDSMLHPIRALTLGLFLASPGLLLGGVGFWWFSPQRLQPIPAEGVRACDLVSK